MKEQIDNWLQMKLRDEFNKNAIGTPVIFYPTASRPLPREFSRTTSAAWLLGGHTAVVRIEGQEKHVRVDRIEIDSLPDRMAEAR